MEASDHPPLAHLLILTSPTYPSPQIQSEYAYRSMRVIAHHHESLTSLHDDFHEYECMKKQDMYRQEQESQMK
jgi:hypothetical protein